MVFDVVVCWLLRDVRCLSVVVVCYLMFVVCCLMYAVCCVLVRD